MDLLKPIPNDHPMYSPSRRDLAEEVANAAAYLSNIAEQLDAWAEESKTGGWSTHQVHGNINMANSCRRMAAKLRRSII